jgi:hypothetical protein
MYGSPNMARNLEVSRRHIPAGRSERHYDGTPLWSVFSWRRAGAGDGDFFGNLVFGGQTEDDREEFRTIRDGRIADRKNWRVLSTYFGHYAGGMADALERIAMKATTKLVELGLYLTCACAPGALVAVDARPVAVAVNESRRADRQSIQGQLSAKSDTTITVNGKVIAITATTSFMKGGKSILAADVQNGDNVKVMVSRGTDGPLVAESVEVLMKE